MANMLYILRYMPKRTTLIAGLFIAAFVPGALMAWGPERETFTMENPASYNTFNSIVDNPEVGDERNFLVIKDAASTNSGGWQDEITAEPGKEYLVRVYVHNDAAENHNLEATNTRVKVNVPTDTGKKVSLGGFVTADNATPKEVWDDAALVGDYDFNVAYVAGSARLYNNHFGESGAQLSDDIVTSKGALVGYDKLDGVVPGCMKYAGYVTFKVKVQGQVSPDFELKKDVRKTGTTDKYAEKITVQPGEKADFRIAFKNIGDVKLDNVVIKDQLPAGMSLVNDSAKLYNSNYPDGYKLSNDLVTDGVNIGHYGPGINAFVVFTAQVEANDKLPTCGSNKLQNVATVENDWGYATDDAFVEVTKECKTETPKEGGEGEGEPAEPTTPEVPEEKPTTPEEPETPAEPATPEEPKEEVVEEAPVEEEPEEVPVKESPEELPKTGPATILSGLFGTSALGLGVHSWIVSRRALKGALVR